MSKKVLVVDDSWSARRQVINALKRGDYEIIEAGDGQDAIQAVANHPDLAVVVCDINMPRMNGLEMLASLRATPIKIPPFLMLTTEDAPELVAQARASGAKGWMTKPFSPDLLFAAVERLTARVA